MASSEHTPADTPVTTTSERLFPTLRPDQVERLAAHGRRVSVKPGDVLLDVSATMSRMFVVVSGGIGSIRGAFLASLLVGFVDTFGKVFVPQIAGIMVYLLMAAILLWRPEGLFRTS